MTRRRKLAAAVTVLLSGVTTILLAANPSLAAESKLNVRATITSVNLDDAAAWKLAQPATTKQNQARATQGAGADVSELRNARARSQALSHISRNDCRNSERGADGSKWHFWVRDHFNFCQWGYKQINVYSTDDTMYLGSASFRYTLTGWTAASDDAATARKVDFDMGIDRWTTFFIDPRAVGGHLLRPNRQAVVTSPLQIGMQCEGSTQADACKTTSPNIRQRIVLDWARASDETGPNSSYQFASDRSTGAASDKYKITTGTFYGIFSIPPLAGCRTAGRCVISWPSSVRFDSAGYLKNAFHRSDTYRHGAVFDQVLPFLRYRLSEPTTRDVAQHINTAFTNPGSTYPQVPGKNIPGKWPGKDFVSGSLPESALLHRQYPATRRPTAISAACREYSRNIEGNPKGDYVIDPATGQRERQCDEFPFNAAKESGSNTNSNFSARPVNGDHNVKAGDELGYWLSTDRVINDDRFTVDIAP